jgi:hypothetical protein
VFLCSENVLLRHLRHGAFKRHMIFATTCSTKSLSPAKTLLTLYPSSSISQHQCCSPPRNPSIYCGTFLAMDQRRSQSSAEWKMSPYLQQRLEKSHLCSATCKEYQCGHTDAPTIQRIDDCFVCKATRARPCAPLHALARQLRPRYRVPNLTPCSALHAKLAMLRSSKI